MEVLHETLKFPTISRIEYDQVSLNKMITDQIFK